MQKGKLEVMMIKKFWNWIKNEGESPWRVDPDGDVTGCCF